jgi:hypothetical protein
MCLQVEFAGICAKRCLIRIFHVVRTSSDHFIPCEEHFRPVLPTIAGNVDYLTLRGQLTTIDELLRTSGVEKDFVMRSLEHWVRALHGSKVREMQMEDPRALRQAMKDEGFAQAQRRRAQSEARVAIFKNEFLGRPMRSEGFENRALLYFRMRPLDAKPFSQNAACAKSDFLTSKSKTRTNPYR